jgi:hypothetical protein
MVAGTGCKKVPSPWIEQGVPGDHLEEVFAGTNADQYMAAYDQNAFGLVIDTRAGLAKNGFVPCGEIERAREVTGHLTKEGVLWSVIATQTSSTRTTLHIKRELISKTEASRAAAKRAVQTWSEKEDLWWPAYRTGCLHDRP